MKVDVPETSN